MRTTLVALGVASLITMAAPTPRAWSAAPAVLFIGNSFTFADGSPVRFYRSESVTDLNDQGIGGVPALFKSFATQAKVDVDVSLETQPGVGLDWHLANKRDAIARRPWDIVIMHGYSTLDAAKAGDPAKLVATTKEMADLLRAANPKVEIHLMSTWPRADQTYQPNGHWFGKPIAAMTSDVRAAYDKAATGAGVTSVVPVGNAWLRAIESGAADANPYDGIDAGKMNLWAADSYHASAFGYYLEALMDFGAVTKRDPRSLGTGECSAFELGFSAAQTRSLQDLAYAELAEAGTLPRDVTRPTTPTTRAPMRGCEAGWRVSARHVAALVRIGVLASFTAAALAQAPAQAVRPVRSAPTEVFTVNPGFRDWAPTVVAGTSIIGGNSSNRGGLFAVDIVTGKLKWSARPLGTASGNPFVASRPAVSGNVVVAPMGNTLLALSMATGKELWRGPATALRAAAAADAESAFVAGEDNFIHAVDLKTGRDKWKVEFASSGSCPSVPVVRNGLVYVTGRVVVTPGDANRAASYYRHLFALDATTGQERWRYPATPVGTTGGICFDAPVANDATIFAIGGQTLYGLDAATGRERWKPVEVRRPVEGRERAVSVQALTDAGSVVVGITQGYLIAFDKATGRTAWEIAGQYRESSPSLGVADGVLYFQGHPGAPPAAEVQGTITYVGGKPVQQAPALPPGRLNALDLSTRAILWSFSRPTAEANWPFGFVTPVDGGLWVDSYQALIKLQ